MLVSWLQRQTLNLESELLLNMSYCDLKSII